MKHANQWSQPGRTRPAGSRRRCQVGWLHEQPLARRGSIGPSRCLGRLEARAATAVPALSTALAHHAELAVRQRAAWALGKVGPAAASARDALTQAAASPDPPLASLAHEALDSIGGQ